MKPAIWRGPQNENYHIGIWGRDMGMRPSLPRRLFKVAQDGGVWTVQIEDGPLEVYANKDEA